MGWRFRKSIKIFPGIKLNFGKKGYTSTTIGGKYAKTNIGKKGVRNTYSLPGTGLSYQTQNQPRQMYSTNTTPLNRYCSNCGLMNAPDSDFCHQCGGSCPPNPQSNTFNSSKVVVPIVIVASFFGLCVLCGMIGAINDSLANKSRNASNSTAVSLVSTRNPNIPPTETKTVKSSPNKQPTISSDKTADIISENANLRDSANANGNVIATISQGETVGIIKQKGAWFYVETSQGKGWLHGNTIELNISESLNQPQTKPTPRTVEIRPTQTPESVNPTGATARCADGTLSYSAHRRGTCSHHGGVSIWY